MSYRFRQDLRMGPTRLINAKQACLKRYRHGSHENIHNAQQNENENTSSNYKNIKMVNESNLGLEITELRLGLPGESITGKKRVSPEVESELKCEPATKSQAVGWPPVCSFRRKNSLEKTKTSYVKVSVDGAAFLRKIDLEMYKCYQDLASALQILFGCFINFDGTFKESECVPIYEDKDGDWMLVGDVPWEMFIGSCKRLRIMKRSSNKE